MPVRTGLEGLLSPHLTVGSTLAIAGDSAALVAEALRRAGGPPLAVEADRFALLSDELNAPAVGRVRDLPEGSVDAVVLRRAWDRPTDIVPALRIAQRAVRPGGEVIVADIDAQRLLAGPAWQYPMSLVFSGAPAVANNVRSSSASPTLLVGSAVRSGLADIDGFTYDDILGEYEDVEGFVEGVRRRGWRGGNQVDVDEGARLLGATGSALSAAIPVGAVVDREPWFAVIGSVV